MKRLKRNQMKKPFRFLAGLLSLILVVSLFPQGLRTVQAAGNVLETDGGKITWDFEGRKFSHLHRRTGWIPECRRNAGA